MGDGKSGGGSKLLKRLVFLAVLGGGGYGAVFYKVWDQFAPPALQALVGRGALASPDQLARETKDGAPAAGRLRGAALGKVVRWRGKVIDIRRPISGNPSLTVRSGDATVRVEFPAAADAELRALSPGADVGFQGRITRVPPEEITLADGALVP